MVHIDTSSHLESFRRFLINSTCLSFMPESYLRDPEVFPEREDPTSSIYVEAADKVTLKKIREITFVNARDILGVIYASKSGNTKLKWRQTRGKIGRVTGEASANSLVNLFAAEVISQEYAEELTKSVQVTPQVAQQLAPAQETTLHGAAASTEEQLATPALENPDSNDYEREDNV